jgi:hypothetical protein
VLIRLKKCGVKQALYWLLPAGSLAAVSEQTYQVLVPNAPDRGDLHPEIFLCLAPEMEDGTVAGDRCFSNLNIWGPRRPLEAVTSHGPMFASTRELKFKSDNCQKLLRPTNEKTTPLLITRFFFGNSENFLRGDEQTVETKTERYDLNASFGFEIVPDFEFNRKYYEPKKKNRRLRNFAFLIQSRVRTEQQNSNG